MDTEDRPQLEPGSSWDPTEALLDRAEASRDRLLGRIGVSVQDLSFAESLTVPDSS